ncbi:MAG: hypothetical protein GVY27_13585 [Deinococcus-Thermus bacterium]|jgi:uncharacterized membrane protein YjjP (DUF1212 family)|nr:hypothetical protein [Deinococcota bacterium]
MNLISVLIGLAALLGALVGFLPLLGWLNWLVIPVALVGLVIGMLARERAGRNVNAVVLVFAVVRLALGGGVV